ncbi:hypothetical protein EXIGLDRAFT_205606 [Exidia glandulosa HHB12029]|uniref:Uncharacterized protein n=1 Tax=Exidia glandulosa HHB12029 TaxID=1314781 RepID=A0A165MVD2_EXIGL|nr:hypothetical protein EXIGLDRAFT_205606 [Exidia glandulosa HHB12029]
MSRMISAGPSKPSKRETVDERTFVSCTQTAEGRAAGRPPRCKTYSIRYMVDLAGPECEGDSTARGGQRRLAHVHRRRRPARTRDQVLDARRDVSLALVQLHRHHATSPRNVAHARTARALPRAPYSRPSSLGRTPSRNRTVQSGTGAPAAAVEGTRHPAAAGPVDEDGRHYRLATAYPFRARGTVRPCPARCTDRSAGPARGQLRREHSTRGSCAAVELARTRDERLSSSARGGETQGRGGRHTQGEGVGLVSGF